MQNIYGQMQQLAEYKRQLELERLRSPTGSWEGPGDGGTNLFEGQAPRAPAPQAAAPVSRVATSLRPAVQAPTQPAAPQAPSGPPAVAAPDWDARREPVQANIEGLNAPQDMSALQTEGRRRGEQGMSGLAMALAAQRAGPGFDAVQQHMLKQAMEARQPQKYTGGTINDQGDVLADPGYAIENRRRMYEGQLANIDRGQAAAAAAAAATAAANQRNQDNIASRKEIAEMRAAMVAAGGGGAQQARLWRAEDTLRDDVTKVTANYVKGLDAAQQAQSIIANASAQGRNLTNVEQQSVITMFNHITDPTSVVREGEYNRMAQGMGLWQNIQNLGPKIAAGSVITPQMAKQIGDAAKLYEMASTEKIRGHVTSAQQIAVQRGLDPRAVVTDKRFTGDAGAVPGAPASGGSGSTVSWRDLK